MFFELGAKISLCQWELSGLRNSSKLLKFNLILMIIASLLLSLQSSLKFVIAKYFEWKSFRNVQKPNYFRFNPLKSNFPLFWKPRKYFFLVKFIDDVFKLRKFLHSIPIIYRFIKCFRIYKQYNDKVLLVTTLPTPLYKWHLK